MKVALLLVGIFLFICFAESSNLNNHDAVEEPLGDQSGLNLDISPIKRLKRGLKKMLKRMFSREESKKDKSKEKEIRPKPKAPPMNPGVEAELNRLAMLPDKVPLLSAMSRLVDDWTSMQGLARLCHCRTNYCDCCATSPFKGPGCLTLEAKVDKKEVKMLIFNEKFRRARKSTTIQIFGGSEMCMTILDPMKICFIPISTQYYGVGGIEGCFIMRIALIAKTLCLRYQPGANAYVINMI